MSVQEVLIKPGQTPSGFGLALLRKLDASGTSFYLRPLSPCCGAFILSDHDYQCDGCGKSYQAFSDENRGTIGNPVPLGTDFAADTTTLSRWIARIMQYPDPEGNHGIKVKITWR